MGLVARCPFPVPRSDTRLGQLHRAGGDKQRAISELPRATDDGRRATRNGQRTTGNDSNGFTLLELTLVVILSILITAVLGLIVAQGMRGGLAQAARRELTKEGMAALERMSREIRAMTDTDDGATEPCIAVQPGLDITTATNSILYFSKSPSTTSICYELDANGTLWRRSTCAGAGACSAACTTSEALARNVVNAGSDIFDYYAYDGTAAATNCDIWRIEVNLQLRRGTSTSDPYRNITLQTSVWPRDLGER